MKKLIILLFGLSSIANGGVVIMDSLPFTPSHSADKWDTLIIHPDSNGALHSDRMGIIFSGSDNDYWLIDLSGNDGIPGNADDDSIVFGMDSSKYNYSNECGVAGIYTGYGGSAAIAESLIFRGGYIVHLPTGIDENSHYDDVGFTAVNATGICSRRQMKNCIVDSVAEIMVKGFGMDSWADQYYYYGVDTCINDSSCCPGGLGVNCDSIKNKNYTQGSKGIYTKQATGLLIRNTTIKTRHYGYKSRLTYCSDAVSYASAGQAPALSGSQEYHIRFEDCYIDIVGHNGLNLWGMYGTATTDNLFVAQVESCTLKIDNHNNYPPTGWTNGWCIHYRGAGSNDPYYSYVKDNVFLSGTSFAGGRGMELREGNSKAGTACWTDTVEISGNYFDMHQGSDVEYSSVWGSTCMKLRRGNRYYWIHDNTFIQTLDSIYAIGANYHRHGTCVTYQIEMGGTDPWRAPYHFTFEDNVCSLRVLRDSTGFGANNAYIWGGAMSIDGVPTTSTPRDTTIKVKDNIFYSEGGTCIIFGSQWDASLQHYLLGPDNTLELNDDSGFTKAAYSLIGYVGNNGIVTRDQKFAGDAYDTSISHYYKTHDIAVDAGKTWELTFQRTLELYVKGNNGKPVVGATVYCRDKDGNTVISGITNSGGRVTGIVDYYYYNRNEADATHNNFVIYAEVGADNDTDTLTVSWSAAGGTATLYLLNTEGTGERDTIPPARIDDLGAVPGTTAGTIILGWTAPGDDGDIGTADSYIIRYSTESLDESNWASAETYADSPNPIPAGNYQSIVMTGLTPGEYYYIAAKARDDSGHESNISNIAFSEAGAEIISGKEDGETELSAPAPGATVLSSRPNLVVVNIDEQSDNVYYFEVAADSVFTQKIAISPAVNQQPGGMTSWKVSSPLETGRIYFWRARANDDPYDLFSAFQVEPSAYAYPNPFMPESMGNVVFTEVPAGSSLILVTVSGEIIRRWADTDGADIIWDGTSESGKAVASDVYLWYLEGTDAKGKIVVIW